MRIEGRLTRYRSVVLEALRATENHPTAAEVFRMVRRRRPGVAYATIYNSLNWLEQKGFIARVDFAEEAARYDPIVERHDHLVCSRCGTLKDVSLELSARGPGGTGDRLPRGALPHGTVRSLRALRADEWGESVGWDSSGKLRRRNLVLGFFFHANRFIQVIAGAALHAIVGADMACGAEGFVVIGGDAQSGA
jgi:predicted transcriptional regulator